MPRPTNEIIRDIDAFTPIDGVWLLLDALLAELFQHPISAKGITAMLRVLERYPTEDGAGVLWSIVHGLESLPDYEPYLVASIRKTPSHLGLVMLHRILKSGQTNAANTSFTTSSKKQERAPTSPPRSAAMPNDFHKNFDTRLLPHSKF